MSGRLDVSGPTKLSQGLVTIEGDLEVTGDIRLSNADLAEDFDLAPAVSIEPGSVLVITADGLAPCDRPNDTRAAGVVSGAVAYRPAIVLDRSAAAGGVARAPIAMVGKVYCRVDSRYGAIAPGDLLTTSATPGHAMRADPPVAAGSVVGKALAGLDAGQGMIPILVMQR